MQETTFTEFRNRASEFFKLVEAGQAVRVLRHGKPIADILPVVNELPSWKQRRARPLAISGAKVSARILRDRGPK